MTVADLAIIAGLVFAWGSPRRQAPPPRPGWPRYPNDASSAAPPPAAGPGKGEVADEHRSDTAQGRKASPGGVPARTIRDIVAAFELAWNRATPHAEYKPD